MSLHPLGIMNIHFKVHGVLVSEERGRLRITSVNYMSVCSLNFDELCSV